MDSVIQPVIDLLALSVIIWACSKAQINFPNWVRKMKLEAYTTTYSENNPILSIIQCVGPNLPVMVATLQNNAGQQISQ